MKCIHTLIALIGICLLVAAAADSHAEPIPLIFDTDIGNDCDDVLALGVIHALQSRGECELLAVTITKDHKLAAAFTDVVNTFLMIREEQKSRTTEALVQLASQPPVCSSMRGTAGVVDE